jgi:hypothetical protein
VAPVLAHLVHRVLERLCVTISTVGSSWLSCPHPRADGATHLLLDPQCPPSGGRRRIVGVHTGARACGSCSRGAGSIAPRPPRTGRARRAPVTSFSAFPRSDGTGPVACASRLRSGSGRARLLLTEGRVLDGSPPILSPAEGHRSSRALDFALRGRDGGARQGKGERLGTAKGLFSGTRMSRSSPVSPRGCSLRRDVGRMEGGRRGAQEPRLAERCGESTPAGLSRRRHRSSGRRRGLAPGGA